MSDEIQAQFFTTVTDMRAVPEDKIDAFCEDFRMWLHLHKQFEGIQALFGDAVKITSPVESFGWIDDGKHDATVTIKALGEPPSTHAVGQRTENPT